MKYESSKKQKTKRERERERERVNRVLEKIFSKPEAANMPEVVNFEKDSKSGIRDFFNSLKEKPNFSKISSLVPGAKRIKIFLQKFSFYCRNRRYEKTKLLFHNLRHSQSSFLEVELPKNSKTTPAAVFRICGKSKLKPTLRSHLRKENLEAGLPKNGLPKNAKTETKPKTTITTILRSIVVKCKMIFRHKTLFRKALALATIVAVIGMAYMQNTPRFYRAPEAL